MGWTVILAMLLWFGLSVLQLLLAGQSVQQTFCGLVNHYSNSYVGCTVNTATCMWAVFSSVNVFWAGLSVLWLSFELNARVLLVWFLALARFLFSTPSILAQVPLILLFILLWFHHKCIESGVHLTTFLCLMLSVLPLPLYSFRAIVPLLWCFCDAFFPVPAEFRLCQYEPVTFVYLRMYRLNHLCYS